MQRDDRLVEILRITYNRAEPQEQNLARVRYFDEQIAKMAAEGDQSQATPALTEKPPQQKKR